MKHLSALCLAASLALATTAIARPEAGVVGDRYTVDPQHTYPSFEADHMGGLSVWRGKFNRSHGHITLDRAHGTGLVDVTVDTDSIDFGLDALNAEARTKDLLDTSRYPAAHYTGRLANFVDGAPTRVIGTLSLHGTTRPLDLQVLSFKCMPHPMLKRELCGADALAHFDRSRFGMDAGKDYGFDMNVTLRIQVEALRDK
ncbi:YceI family protein [Oleiagrimonas soli]|uniref:Polyisoprenoid-binding protein n=1 Tax=Oleiagrimonas soli TaxID=1543381 RepID=A0A099CXC8_9GAMM|nr:YceI family protein [Oleiagrimonas soli]KGI77665.1 polyisoprenoid-binding protein [Oleiagrimonas soli]MBB6182815.1 polyisoprenoid-binding protein YceI [Oleiagrimonas soli]